jgi:putative membrane-bound dehydrogenase-like protein
MKIQFPLLFLAVSILNAATPTSNAPFLKPQEAIAKMTIPDGFEVKAFVAEPDIGEAIAFCFDEKGRLWTLENYNYQTRGAHSKDKRNRIQIFEDVDGDGVFDKKKLFTDQLTFSSGIAVGMGGVYVGMPPELIFIPDADGDDKPDGAHEVLLDGWGIHDRHETLNSFIWGPDGWLYGCHGVFTKSEVGKPGAAKEDRQFIDGGIWRWHPVREEFEIFAEGLSNPWGFDFNDQGQGFATCCVIPHLFHVVQGGIYDKQSRQNVNPYVYDNIKTIRDHAHQSAHGGARFYLADTFPEKYRDQLFMCNIHQHSVLTDVMVPKGSSYVGKHGEDFMPTNDLAWVGFSVEIGPEGGVYILDWHDQNICGNVVKFPNSGRVYRIMPKGSKPIKRPNLGSMGDLELVELQNHANDWYVRHARVLLHHRAVTGKLEASKVHEKLEQMLKTSKTQGKRLRALWALQVTGGLTANKGARLIELLSDADEYVRAWSVQFLCDEKKPSEKALARFVEMAASDKSAVVRMYLAAALQRLSYGKRWPILAALAAHEEDVNDHLIPRMLWIALEAMVPEHGPKALELALASKMPKLQEFVPRRMLVGDAPSPKPSSSKADWQNLIQKAAPNFTVEGSGEGGVVRFGTFRNKTATRTHPIKRGVPSVLSRKLQVYKGKKTVLRATVSHHPHGDWELRVKVDGKIISKTEVSSKTTTDEWLVHEVDLSPYGGKEINLQLENNPTGWGNEWAYWNEVKVAIVPLSLKKR